MKENQREFFEIVKEYKEGNKNALVGTVYDVRKYHREDQEAKKYHIKAGIKELVVLDEELEKNYQHFMKSTKYKHIDLETRRSLFWTGFMEALESIVNYDSNKEVLSFFQTVIDRKFINYIRYLILEGVIDESGISNTISDESPASRQAFNELSMNDYYNIEEPLTTAEEFLNEVVLSEVLTKTEEKVLAFILKNEKNKEIAELMAVSPKTISFHKINIQNKIQDKYEAFKELNQRATGRLTSDIITFLDHIDRISKYYTLDDELMYHDIIEFTKKQYLRVNSNNSETGSKEIEKMHKNTIDSKYTIIELLTDHITPKTMEKIQAILDDEHYWGEPKGEGVQTFSFKGTDIYATKGEKKRFAKVILKAFYSHLDTHKKSIEENVKLKRLASEKNKVYRKKAKIS
ncbi:LuxR C-terminal-related transcriptional regulator [Priestia koreensis]|uniref:LuxR C-terminal-related transcriptional regulator n=1 Tax=Priestia koreensis TaxID=284581 RepID=UPI003D06DA21